MILYCRKTEWNRVIDYTWVWPVWRHLLRRDPGGAGQAARPVQAKKAKDGTFGRGVWPRSPPHHLAASLSEPLASCTASSRQLCRVAAAASSWGCLSNGFADDTPKTHYSAKHPFLIALMVTQLIQPYNYFNMTFFVLCSQKSDRLSKWFEGQCQYLINMRK